MTQAETLEYIQSLNVRRTKRRVQSWVLIGGGLLIYLDAGWRFPIWLTGIWAFALGTPLILTGLALLASTYKLPTREALLFASLHDGRVTAPSLSMALDITLDTSEEILAQLVEKGYAQVSTEDMETGAVVYKISGIEKL
jgi:hypothetical protein